MFPRRTRGGVHVTLSALVRTRRRASRTKCADRPDVPGMGDGELVVVRAFPAVLCRLS